MQPDHLLATEGGDLFQRVVEPQRGAAGVGDQCHRTATGIAQAVQGRRQAIGTDATEAIHLERLDGARAQAEDTGGPGHRIVVLRGGEEAQVAGVAVAPDLWRNAAARGDQGGEVGQGTAVGQHTASVFPRGSAGRQRLFGPANLAQQPVDHEQLNGGRRRPHLVDRHRVVGEAVDQ